MKRIILIFVSAVVLVACGRSYEEQKRLTRAERQRLAREDSAALKIAVTPTLDCLPLYVAQYYGLFDGLGADVRLKRYAARMDCDEALRQGRVEGLVTDLVRGQRLVSLGTPLEYLTATGAYWQLLTNRNARIKELKQLNDKMVAMTRYSATDMLSDYAVDSVGLAPEMVFRIQVNDMVLRLRMLENNEMDALLLTEPQATAARMLKHPVLMDSRKLGMRLGAVAVKSAAMGDTARQRQVKVMLKAYDMACDSIRKHGLKSYRRLIAEKCGVDEKVAAALPKDIRFDHAAPPRREDIDRAEAWLTAKVADDRITPDDDGGK